MHEYKVTIYGNVAGYVCVSKEGLYTRFQCSCQLPDDQVYRLIMICDDKETDLGVLVPEGTQFVVNKRYQSKQITNGEMTFQIVPANQNSDQVLFSVSQDMPFAHISKLEYAHLCNESGRYGIVISTSQHQNTKSCQQLM